MSAPYKLPQGELATDRTSRPDGPTSRRGHLLTSAVWTIKRARISAVVQNRLYPERFKQHGVIQNGILLYGPRGTGKTFLAEATAGEFKINYWYAKPTSLIESRIGNSEANIRETFSRAYAHRPVLFFLDEIDSIGTQRQQLGRNDDVGGGARLYNSVVTELMQCIDQYRGATGFILMAATNFYDGLDEALVRDMRFDEKIRVDLPDEATRAQILSAQLSKRLWTPFSGRLLCKAYARLERRETRRFGQ